MRKPTRTVEQLQAMIQVRLYALPAVQRLLSSGTPPNSLPAASLPVAHPIDVRQRNWECRSVMHADGLEHDIAEIIDTLRDSYDLGSEG